MYNIKDQRKVYRTRPLDCNDGAARRVVPQKGPDPKLGNELCRPVSPSQVRDACGLHDGNEHAWRATASMAFIQRNNVVQEVSSAAPHPPLRDSHFCHGLRNEVRLGIIRVAFTAAITSNPNFLIAIKDQVFVRGFKWKRLAQLLDDPSARRMLRDVNVQDAPPIMTDNKKSNRARQTKIVGTVKKSIAAIASRWFRRKASQRLAGQDLSAPVSSNGRWFSRKGQSRAFGVPHVSAALPRWGFQRPYGRSIPEPPSVSVFFRPASGLCRSAASTYKNQSGASGRWFRA